MAQIKKTKIEIVQPAVQEKIEKSEITKVREEPTASSKNGINILRRLGKAAIYLLVFLLPLFFLPWTSNTLDFSKQALLLSLVFVSLICWLISNLISNRFEINTNFLNIPVAVLFLTSALSVVFSVFRYGSFWGWPLSVSQSLLSLIGFIVFYFLVTNLFKKNEIVFLFLTLFLSGFIASLFGILQLFGKFVLPFDFAKTTSFNTIGTVNSLAVYNSLLLILLLPLSFFVKRFFKIILGIFIVVLLASLFIINFKTAWLVFLAGIIVLFAFGVVNVRKFGKSSYLTLMIFFLIIALLFSFFRFSLPGAPAAPLEASPSQKAEWMVLKQLPLKSLFLGSGLGTFIYDWSKYKPLDLNQTVFWSARFNKGASEILDRTITSGILGVLVLLFLIFVFFRKAILFLIKNFLKKMNGKIPDGISWFLVLGIVAAFTALVCSLFLYPANFSIWLIFWLLIGATALMETDKKKIFIVDDSPAKALAFSFASVLILVLEIGFSIVYCQKYVAEVRYSQGLVAFQAGNNVLATNYISKAINSNPQMDVYWRDLSQIHLIRLREVLNDPDLTPEIKSSQSQALVASAVNSATQATMLNPVDVAGWNVRGFIYRNLIGILGGADDWAIKSYETAAELEPVNPYIFTEIGRIYIVKANLAIQQENSPAKEENLKLAQAFFEKAVSLKADYAPANYQIAAIYIEAGKTKEAISSLQLAQQAAPLDIGLAFQLGVIYYDEKQFDNARVQFERAVALDPGYSNARYFLGLIYDRQGNKNEAILQFKTIEELNPENQEVKKILSNLRGGKTALEGIVPSEPPVEEKSPEGLEK